MNAGPLRDRITIQSFTESQSSSGAAVLTWSDVVTVWAEVRAATGYERFRTGTEIAQISHMIRIRYRAGVTPKNRILVDDRIFDITSVGDPDGRRIELMIWCTERIDN